MIETTTERYENFVSEVGEFSLFHETGPSLPFLRLEASFYDDCESSLPLEPNVVDYAPLTDQEEVAVSPWTSFPLIGPSFSSDPIVTSVRFRTGG